MTARTALALLCLLLPRLVASDELDARLRRIFASDAFAVKRFGPARWVKGGTAFTTVEPSPTVEGADQLVEHDTRTGVRTVVVATPKDMRIEDYSWDPDGKRVLVFTNSQRVWRSNTRGDYWVFERGSTAAPKKLGGDRPAKSLMFAKFAPGGSQVAWVSGNNLYVEELSSGKLTALTTDGSETLVYGTSDWVYEEELNVRDGFRWSPDGRQIAFYQFDSSGVQQFTLINNTDSLYPKTTLIPYPKAGTKNSAVRVGVVSAGGGPVRWMEVPGDPRENYLFRMEWVDAGHLAIAQLNRKQNQATVYLADTVTGAAKPVFRDTDDAWVDVPENGVGLFEPRGFDWLKGNQAFLWPSERDGWRHAYRVPADGKQPVAVTRGEWDVEALLAADPDNRWLYFLASPGNATEKYLYRVSLDPGAAREPERLTPQGQPGTHSYRLSPDCHWAFHTWSAFDRPPVTELISLPAHKTERVLEDNAKLRANVAASTEPPVEFLQVRVGDGITLDGWLLKPRNFDPAKKYPLIVHVYGEPAGVTVTNSWHGDTALFHRALAEDGYLVASFDNRGTPAPKGRAWRKAVYGAVGVLSAQEQTQAVYALARQRPYVDVSRVGVWGWSGGGSNTLNLMFRSPELFRVGVSVAPVPDQKLYDTIYQERYMGLPDENASGYRAGSPVHFAEGLSGKLLIVHGTGDDNVHQQGTERLVNRLIELGKPFDYMAYPNRTHAISEGPGTSLHLRRLIGAYFERNLPAGAR